MNNSVRMQLGNKLGVAGGLLVAVVGQAQAAVPLAPVYAPGPAAVGAGSFGGAAVVVWASVLVVTVICLAALALLLRQPRDEAVQAPAREPAVAPAVARSRRLPKRPARRAARVVVLSEPLRRAPRAVRV